MGVGQPWSTEHNILGLDLMVTNILRTKMVAKLASIACAFVLCLSGAGVAQENVALQSSSVKSMYDDCSGRDLEFCSGFLLGVARGLEMLRTYNPKFAKEYCPVQVADSSLYKDTFVAWAEHSKFWNANPFDGAVIAFTLKWACPTAGS